MRFDDISLADIEGVLLKSTAAFEEYRNSSLAARNQLLRTIGACLKEKSSSLIAMAMRETHLPEARLQNELARTVFQLESYGDSCQQGAWLDASIDQFPETVPVKPDLHKTLVPLGPVVVFGSSNFPFAYSTAGGDTASALAAGCTVIVKAHPAHPGTSALAAAAIQKALMQCQMNGDVFQHVYGTSFRIGEALVKNKHTRAVGFTGSLQGGKQLFDWAAQRKIPIPVFAEMGSVNPVFLFPERLEKEVASLATQLAHSFTLGVGQFCTKPGLVVGIEGAALQSFIHDLGKAVQQIHPASMLHEGITTAFLAKREAALLEDEVHLVAESSKAPVEGQGQATVATVDASTWLLNPLLHEEIFGPFTLVVRCRDRAQMKEVALAFEGQLTTTFFGEERELLQYADIVQTMQERCGRCIFNGVPTGVEVCKSMQHGGPFPASTDARFGSVGGDAIKRFARPLSFQNWPPSLLPLELQPHNPLKIPRTVNGKIVW